MEATSIRPAELVTGESASRFDFAALCDMNHYILQGIYERAVKIRIINIEKLEPALGGVSIQYSDYFDIIKDATYILDNRLYIGNRNKEKQPLDLYKLKKVVAAVSVMQLFVKVVFCE